MTANNNLLQKILLIDDNPEDRFLAIRELKHEFNELQVQEVSTLDSFAQYLDSDFDLVVTDYQLNWTTGIEILHRVKAVRPHCPVVMFTNTGTQEIAVAAMKAGLDDYVVKSPKHLIRLAQAVRSAWERVQTRKRIAQLEFRLRSLLEKLSVGVFRINQQGQLISANDAFLSLLGLPDFKTAETFFTKQIKPILQKTSVQGQIISEQKQEFSVCRPDGKQVWLLVSQAGSQDHELFMDGLLEDISDRKRAEIALKQFNQELELRVKERTAELRASNQELETFVYSVSHDLRSPMRHLHSLSEILTEELESVDLNETAKDCLASIQRLTIQTNQLINSLLQFSRTGRVEMHYSTVDMNQLVEQVRQNLEWEPDQGKVDWQIESLPSVVGDRQLLIQVWQNLIENAVKYSSRSRHPQIEIGSREGEDQTIFWVRDNGIGFEPNQSDKLFKLFQRLDYDHDFEGIGIGLASVAQIVRRHGGEVWAEGVKNSGASFYFSLPPQPKHPRNRE